MKNIIWRRTDRELFHVPSILAVGRIGQALFAAAMTAAIVYGILWDIDTPERKENEDV